MTARWMSIGEASRLPDQSELLVIGKLEDGSLPHRCHSRPPGCRINWKNYGVTLKVDFEKHKATDVFGFDPNFVGLDPNFDPKTDRFGLIEYDNIEVFIDAPEGTAPQGTPDERQKRGGRPPLYDPWRILFEAAVLIGANGVPNNLSGENSLVEKVQAALGFPPSSTTTVENVLRDLFNRIKAEREQLEPRRKVKSS